MITIVKDGILAKDYYEHEDVIKLIKDLEKQKVLTINKEIGIDLLKNRGRL